MSNNYIEPSQYWKDADFHYKSVFEHTYYTLMQILDKDSHVSRALFLFDQIKAKYNLYKDDIDALKNSLDNELGSSELYYTLINAIPDLMKLAALSRSYSDSKYIHMRAKDYINFNKNERSKNTS